MDELLSLMGEGSSSTVNDTNTSTEQEESSSFSRHGHVPESSSSSAPAAIATSIQRGRSNDIATNSYAAQSTSVQQPPNHNDQKRRAQQLATVDPLTKLRIINRRVSRLDLSDVIAPYQFVSTAKLAAMSLRDLDALVTVPSRGSSSNSNDNSGGGQGFTYSAGPDPNGSAFTGGKTDCATMGVLFGNSGSKVSPSTGRAYSIFQLGDLSTGPTVSLFLFGDAYSKHTGNGSYSGRVGSVVAILAPNILPPKRGGETSVSLSVNNPDQIVHVGTAQDYGSCAGMVRFRRDGKFVDGRCKKYVDKRCGLYCAAHRNQGLQQQVEPGGNKMVSTASKKNATYLQQFRSDGRANRTGVNNMMASNTNTGRAAMGSGSTLVAQTVIAGRGGMQASSSLADALTAAGMQSSQPSASMTNMTQSDRSKPTLNAPLHMKIMSIPGQVTRSSNPQSTTVTGSSAYASAKYKRPPLTRAGKDVFGDTLNQSRSGSETRTSLVPKAKPKSKKIAHFSGFNGSVQVPQPSRSLFGNTASTSSGPELSRSSMVPPAVTPSPNPLELREKQRRLAEEMRKRKHGIYTNKTSESNSLCAVNNPYRKGSAITTSAAACSTTSKIGGGSTQDRMNDIFAGLEDLDRADAIAAKSKYENEADAEQYARSRRLVNDLEKKESKTNARDERRRKQGGGSGDSDDKGIQTEWICSTCGRTVGSKPIACITRGHKVKKKRSIKTRPTREESRDVINKKRAEDGGLQLGSGLEWSGFKGA